MSTLDALLKDYLDYLVIEKNRSIKTRINYERYIRHFLLESGVKKPEEITAEAIRHFRLALAQKRLKKNTQNYYAIALRTFLKYLAKRDIKSFSPDKIELGKMPSRDLDLISKEELQRLLEAPLIVSQNSMPTLPTGQAGGKQAKLKSRNSGKSASLLRQLRDAAILETLFSTGLRISELCSLTRDQVNLKTAEFTVRGKGDKIRLVFLSSSARSALTQYLQKRTDVSDALFIGIPKIKAGQIKDYNRITPRQVQRLIRYYTAKAGLSKKITPHTLRHLFATDLLRNGANIRSVQAMLGHSSLSTTQIYTHFTDPELKDIHEKYHDKK